MKISKIPGLGNYGIYIDGIDFKNITDEEWLEIGQLHLKNLVTIIRKTNCTKDQMVTGALHYGETRYGVKTYLTKKYGKSWGELIQDASDDLDYIEKLDMLAIKGLMHTQEPTNAKRDVSRVTGGYHKDGSPKGFFADGELLWHSNESGTLTFTPGVMLLGHRKVKGSATGFITTPDYYESVSESFRKELDDMIIIHRFTPGKINPGLNEQQDAIMRANMCPVECEIPMVIQSPGGIKGLHYSINTVYGIKGMSKKDSDKLFKKINKELFVEKYQYDHWYKNNGDLLMFDNTITLHRRLGNIAGRLCYRVAHDYTNLQSGAYQPYFQEPYRSRYVEEIRHAVRLAGVENFKMPYTGLVDRIRYNVERLFNVEH